MFNNVFSLLKKKKKSPSLARTLISRATWQSSSPEDEVLCYYVDKCFMFRLSGAN